MILGPDYDQIELAARRANAEKLRESPNSRDVQTKINSWAARFGLEPEFVRYKFLTDDTFALNFVKDPGRQTMHEALAATHIKTRIPFVSHFEKLPSGGASALYVVDGGLVIPGEQLHATTSVHGKSIDFRWTFSKEGKVLSVCCTHKHTKEGGGSQDNQFMDVKRFMQAARDCRDHNAVFLAICDGAYYQQAYDRRPSRIAALNEDFNGRRLRACCINELSSVYASFVERWMEFHKMSLTEDEAGELARMR